LAERGEAPANFRTPAQLTEQDLNQADLIIMLDDNEHRPYVQQRYPTWEDQVVYWRIADLWAGLTAEQALSRIDSMVDQLIAELRSQA
jgi:protein-tyrosine phosphatase